MKKFFFTFAVIASVLTSCHDDAQFEDKNSSSNDSLMSKEAAMKLDLEACGYVASENAYAVTFDRFIDGVTNVKHSDDTTYIEVNKDLMCKVNMDSVKVGDVMDIWESVDNLPYIRVIDAIEDAGNGMTRFTTHAGDLSQVFNAMDMDFSTAIYSDPSKRITTRSSNGETEVSAANGQQFTQGKTVHPAVIYHYDKATKKLNHELCEDRANAITRGVTDYTSNIVNVHKDINWDHAFNDSLKVGVKDGKLDANVDFVFHVNIDWSWLIWRSSVEEFRTQFVGNATLDLPLYIQGQLKEKMTKEVTLVDLPDAHPVFWVGVFPVYIMIDQSIEFNGEMEMQAGLKAQLPIHASLDFQVGPYYQYGNWDKSWSFKPSFSAGFDQMQLEASGTVKASAGVYYKVSARMYSLAGPYVEVGPKLSAEAGASITTTGVSKLATKIYTKGSLAIDGKVGAEVKLINWNLGSFSTPFTLFETDIWNKSTTVEGDWTTGDIKKLVN